MLLNTAKHAWKTSGKKKLHFIYGDMERVFMDISEDFLYSDIDIFLTDSTKEEQNLSVLKSLLQPAMSAGASLYDVAEILTTDSLGELKDKLKVIEYERAEREQMLSQQQQALEEQRLEYETQLRNEDNRIKEEDSIRKAETAIQVALIGAEKSEGEVNDFIDPLEVEKVRLQREKQTKELSLKEKQIQEDIRMNRVAEQQKNEEISIKRKQANKPNKTK